MSTTTVLASSDDQCRIPVTWGSKPASSGVVGKASLSSSVTDSAGGATGPAGTVTAGAAGFAGNGAIEPALGLTRIAWWPRVHHSPAPKPTANSTTAATTARPGRERPRPLRSARAAGCPLD